MTLADPPAPPDAPRFAQIDELRGLAAVLVLLTHAAGTFGPHALRHGHGDAISRVALGVDFGRVGVVLFFVISGFVVANSLGARGMTLRRFAIRRFFRLYPLFWASIAAAAAIAVAPPSAATVLANATMIPAVLGVEPLIGLYWTLETELVFYVVAALLAGTGHLFRPASLLAIMAALIVVFAGLMFGVLPAASRLEWQSLPLNLAFMFWGALFHATRFQPPRDTRDVSFREWAPRAGAALVLAPSAYAFARYLLAGSPDDFRWGVSYPIALALFWGVCAWRRASSGVLVGLGVISYSVYLFHALVVDLLGRALAAGAIGGALASLPAMIAITLVATAALSVATYALVEKPAIAAGRRLSARAGR